MLKLAGVNLVHRQLIPFLHPWYTLITLIRGVPVIYHWHFSTELGGPVVKAKRRRIAHTARYALFPKEEITRSKNKKKTDLEECDTLFSERNS